MTLSLQQVYGNEVYVLCLMTFDLYICTLEILAVFGGKNMVAANNQPSHTG